MPGGTLGDPRGDPPWGPKFKFITKKNNFLNPRGQPSGPQGFLTGYSDSTPPAGSIHHLDSLGKISKLVYFLRKVKM